MATLETCGYLWVFEHGWDRSDCPGFFWGCPQAENEGKRRLLSTRQGSQSWKEEEIAEWAEQAEEEEEGEEKQAEEQAEEQAEGKEGGQEEEDHPKCWAISISYVGEHMLALDAVCLLLCVINAA